jgi:tetratricopeptide (TPR) repeat protein
MTKVRILFLAILLITLSSGIFASSGRIISENPISQLHFGFIDDSISCPEMNSQYRGHFLDWKKTAYTANLSSELLHSWKQMLGLCPAEYETVYTDGVKIMQYRIENEADVSLREVLIDSLMLLYNKQIKYFPNHALSGKAQTGAILGQKGIDLYTYNDKRFAEAYTFLHESFRLENSNTDGMAMVYLFRSVIKMAKNEKIDSLVIYQTYHEISSILEEKVEEFTQSGDKRKVEIYNNLHGNLDETFEAFSKCDDVIRIFQSRYMEEPDNLLRLKQLTEILHRMNCQDHPLYLEINLRLYECKPDKELAFTIAKILVKENKLTEALPFLESATKSEETEIACESFQMMAEVYRQLHNFPASRQYALKAIELNPNDGAAYITIGNLYAASALDCGNDDFSNRTIYWAAVDKFNKALTLDAKVADTAARLIEIYKAQFPDREEILQRELREGSPYTVECWFTEETKIRAAK